MISQNFEKRAQPDPIQERVGRGIFTDREEEMASLMEWVEWVSQKFGRSQALVSHRRYGKTAIMERLYNRLFWEREDVMPFYFELSEGINKIWIQELAENYLYAFLQQFLAYRTRDAGLAFAPKMSFPHMIEIAEKIGEPLVIRTINDWEAENSTSKALKISTILHDLPHYFAAQTGLSIIVMFDEFQRLNQVVYDDETLTRQRHHYTDTFSAAAESSHAPMLIAGSQVTVLVEKALTGAMLGRVGIDYIKRLPPSGAVALVFKFAQRHRLDISLDLAYTIHRLVDGHPYYIWCLFHSKYRRGDLTTEKGVKERLTFEVEDRAGHINEFWRYHFGQNMETFNLPYARQMLLYLSQYVDSEVRVEKIVDDLKLPISVEEANETLRKLIWCDLVRERGNQFYGGLSDPLLAQILRIEYSWEIEQLMRDEAIEQVQAAWTQEVRDAKEAWIGKLQGELNYWVGRFAEMFIDKLMKRHFNGQSVDGTLYFNYIGDIQLSRFRSLFTTMAQPPGATRSYQIDLYGIPIEDDKEDDTAPDKRPWVVEVKNWQKPVGKPQVEHFWEAAQNLAADRGHDKMICWFYARNSFTGPAKEFMKKREMLYTDEAGLIEMLQDFQVVAQWDQ